MTADSVSGSPSIFALRSAIDSRRRIRPATASFVITGSARRPSSSSDACRCSMRSLPAAARVVRNGVAEDVERPFHPCRRCHRGPRRPTQVGIVEVGQPVGGRAHLAAHPALFPRQPRVLGAHPRQQRADGLAVPHDDAVGATHLARLRADAEPTRGADECERSLRSRAADFKRGGPTWLRQRAVGEKRAAPCRLRIGHGAADDLRGQAAHRSTTKIQQTGLTRERLAVLRNAHHVPRTLANSAGGQHMNDCGVAVKVEDVLAKAARDVAEVDLGLDHDAARDDVQTPREPQQRRHLGSARADRINDKTAQLVLDLGCHRHGSSPLGPSTIRAGVGAVGW